MDKTQITSQDANSIIDNALLQAQTGSADTSNAATTLLPTVTPEPDGKPEPKKESAEDRKIKKAQDDLLGKEQAEAQRKEEEERKAREATLLAQAQRLLDKGKASAADVNGKIGSVPTPGSIGFPLFLLAMFFFILIVFNGHTRLQWLWLVLTNNAHVTSGNVTSGSGPSFVPAGQPDIKILAIPEFKPSTNGVYGGPF